jgi:tRNA pseudouridine55 synthase
VGWTSHDVVAVVRRQVGTRAVGHAGTLDPFATGLLVVLVGRATRLARFVESEHKDYDAVIRFGTATDTDDGTGAVIASAAPAARPTRDEVTAALEAMQGTHAQRPPAYSAKHVGGARSYALARAGKAVELASVPVTIHEAAVRDWTPPDCTVTARVGKGTYLRAIARDLGEALGIPAHCAALRRTAIGPFRVEEAIAPTDVSVAAVRPAAEMVRHLPQVVLDAAGCREVGFGRAVAREAGMHGPAALLAADGRLVAIAEAAESGWQPVVVLEPAA